MPINTGYIKWKLMKYDLKMDRLKYLMPVSVDPANRKLPFWQ